MLKAPIHFQKSNYLKQLLRHGPAINWENVLCKTENSLNLVAVHIVVLCDVSFTLFHAHCRATSSIVDKGGIILYTIAQTRYNRLLFFSQLVRDTLLDFGNPHLKLRTADNICCWGNALATKLVLVKR